MLFTSLYPSYSYSNDNKNIIMFSLPPPYINKKVICFNCYLEKKDKYRLLLLLWLWLFCLFIWFTTYTIVVTWFISFYTSYKSIFNKFYQRILELKLQSIHISKLTLYDLFFMLVYNFYFVFFGSLVVLKKKVLIWRHWNGVEKICNSNGWFWTGWLGLSSFEDTF